ncbi:helix-turn-helix transcriptional regulator (plasmid) [Moritella sp. 24]|uniref:helix-turn-helix domain-containing protein n=1 Tax=Moritella sp. 24 TaxID=2746230 RepID=UPI001BA92E14|nr:helix-turn-helix transcriptional regulator [Moritella sp. 24]QUM78760.1 helix-turn-helix transcriptional regulator [Moritella sp. 24]
MPLTELLRKLRANQKSKLEEVAKAMNISREEYFQIEKGLLIPDLYHLDDVAKFYGIDASIFNRYFK